MSSTRFLTSSSTPVTSDQHFMPLDSHVDAEYLARGEAADIWRLVESTSPSGDFTTHRRGIVHKVLRVGPLSRELAVFGTELHSNIWQNFLKEYRAQVNRWKDLHHENLVQVMGLGDGLNLKVEFCEQGSVREYLEGELGHYPKKYHIIAHLLSGLNYMHTLDSPVVHGNLNTGKLFIDARGITKIGEFGLAALCHPFAAFVPSVSLLGLSRWFGPEMLNLGNEGAVQPTTASDVWALGCTLYEIIVGRIPYSNCKHDMQVRRSIRSGNQPGEYGDQFVKHFKHIWPLLTECWKMDPRERPFVSSILTQVVQGFQESGCTIEGQPAEPLHMLDYPEALSPDQFIYPDLDEEIEKKLTLLSQAHGRQETRPRILNELGTLLLDRFVSKGELVDLNQAIKYREQAVSLSSDSHLIMAESTHGLGVLFRSRYECLGEKSDLDRAIGYASTAVSLTPDSDPVKPSMLDSLANSYRARFERFGELPDIENSIKSATAAVELIADRYQAGPSILSNLGNAYLTRFERLGGLPDLNEAIRITLQAVSLAPDGHPGKPSILSILGNSHRARFQVLGNVVDLNEAIEYAKAAVSFTPDGHPNKPSMANSLGNSYRTRFEHLGELADLTKAIECTVGAASLTPDGHPNKPGILNNLATSYLVRFGRLGEMGDLNKAIDYAAEAVSFTPADHPDKPAFFNNLGNSFLARFERLGELSDLSRAIECAAEAVSFTPDGHPDKPGILNDLGNSYRVRFECLGELFDLNKAIECAIEALSLTPDGHPDKPSTLNTLGNSYYVRFERLGELSDLNKAIDCATEAVLLTPDGHPNKLGILNNLGNSYRAQFERLGELSDLNKAIDCATEAVLLTPDGHPSKPGTLNNLGNSYRVRFERLGELSDLNKAIDCATEADFLTPDGHPGKPGTLNNLGNSYRVRFKRLGELSDANNAIECATEAVSLTPDHHPGKSERLSNLGHSYGARLGHSLSPSDLAAAIDSYRGAAESLTGPPLFPVYELAIQLLPQLIWVGNTLDRRYSLIGEAAELTAEAASYAIANKAFVLALEWLEAGRTVVWNQILLLRTPFDSISAHDPALASRLQEVARQLERAGSRLSSVSVAEKDARDIDHEARSRHQLALDWEMLLDKARTIPGFENFLRPPKFKQLLHAAKSHPIVVINVYQSKWDALILHPNNNTVSHVALAEFSLQDAISAHMALCVSAHRGLADRTTRQSFQFPQPLEFPQPLTSLWSGVVKPILDFLGYTHKLPIDQLPRLTWCPTGLLSFLPLHAAGGYDQSEPNAHDLVISSYTPTLSALLANQSTNRDPHRGILVVGQDHGPGFISLPCVRDELMTIMKHAQAFPTLRLDGDEATVDRVLDAMDQFSWVHMACYSTQDPTDAMQSAFHLHDGSLTLAAIAKRSFTNKGLAFLSACETAKGDQDLPDEAIHLAAVMLMAGYPSVIGTMWSITDEDGPLVADGVYAELLKNGGMDHTNAARALHWAVTRLRERVGKDKVARWAPFIHIGS